MSGGDPSGSLRDIRSLFSGGMHGGLTDRQLLERFVNQDGGSAEDAFGILLERHGPMVWGVCRRALPDRNEAADAFQATFLVLMRKAPTVRVDDSLGPWLYGVSRRVASRARTTALRRGARETGRVEALAGQAPDLGSSERLEILDEEIGRLPERQRAVVVLCDLEGLPHEEVASRLGCPVGTVESRLSRGRRRLRDRLVRRGLAPAAPALWAEVARDANAAMPAALITSSTRFVTNAPAAGAVPVAVHALAEGVIRMMWLARLKPLAVVAAAVVLTTAGVAVQGRQQPEAEGIGGRAKAAPPPAVKEANAPTPEIEANRALAREQLALIDQALDVHRRLVQNARAESFPGLDIWERRKREALRRSGAGKAEMIAALEKELENLKMDEAIAKSHKENARGTDLGILDAKVRRIEVEIWLNEEKAR